MHGSINNNGSSELTADKTSALLPNSSAKASKTAKRVACATQLSIACNLLLFGVKLVATDEGGWPICDAMLASGSRVVLG